MKVFGVDFTSAPSRRKPVTAAVCEFDGETLQLDFLLEFPAYKEFENFLHSPGPWIAGFDFPFGLPREAVVALGWPQSWTELATHCGSIGRREFTAASDLLRSSRPEGDKYPKRQGDRLAKSHSPMKCVRPPVGWMFLEGARRLVSANVTVPGMRAGDPHRIAVEAYPGYFARAVVARRSYKNDQRRKQTAEHEFARQELLSALGRKGNPLGIQIKATPAQKGRLIEDASGDMLDSAICAAQAAWAWNRRADNYGLPVNMDPLEGWIVSVPPE